ncbi:hypothetical protein EX30DRAFT_215135 [Ascodesmis nigricans]|uniref:Secreted protein n=1 Tax=Ascodesmis nigricans TaxID=341454 RepID=A0A4S2MZF9_9PEZI|nr:hypothetical protein EX30DRAFT_215135 [Ascodesmis nigricans]
MHTPSHRIGWLLRPAILFCCCAGHRMCFKKCLLPFAPPSSGSGANRRWIELNQPASGFVSWLWIHQRYQASQPAFKVHPARSPPTPPCHPSPPVYQKIHFLPPSPSRFIPSLSSKVTQLQHLSIRCTNSQSISIQTALHPLRTAPRINTTTKSLVPDPPTYFDNQQRVY